MPLHKLSQWLAYSLIEPLQAAGIEVTDIDGLTGLAEYRNGGLFLDTGVLRLRDPADAAEHDVASTLVVEWRALTVALLDRLAELVRKRLGMDAPTLPARQGAARAEPGRRAAQIARAAPRRRRAAHQGRQRRHGVLSAPRRSEAMEGVTVVDHPLVQHKLTLIRDKDALDQAFRALLKEIGMLLCYEVTRDLPLTRSRSRRRWRDEAPQIAGKKLVFAPILRAGMGFVDGMLDLVPAARVAHIGLYREPETFGGRILLQGAGRSSPSASSSSSSRCWPPPTRPSPRSTG